MSARKTLLCLFFFVCLYPFSLRVGNQGVSANYVFLLLPLFYCVTRGVVRKPPDSYLVIMSIFSLIFVVACLYQIWFLEHFVRRSISFLLFMSMFSYMFMRMDAEMVAAFKVAVVGISAYLSFEALATYLSAGGAITGAAARNLVGTHRFGFIYLLALWIAFQERFAGRFWRIGRYPVLFVLLSGVMLSFARSSIVGLLGSFGLFFLASIVKWVRHSRHRISKRWIASTVISGALVFYVIQTVPYTVNFFQERLVDLFRDSDALAESFSERASSEGYRVFIWKTIGDFVAHNPLTGAGYLGVWVLFDDASGSAHNQYMDVLFRTGPIGFALFAYLLVTLLRFLYAHERALFWGIVAVSFYGIGQETFKESQGAFVWAFLLGLMGQRRAVARRQPVQAIAGRQPANAKLNRPRLAGAGA